MSKEIATLKKIEETDFLKIKTDKVPALLDSIYKQKGLNTEAETMYLKMMFNNAKDNKLITACEKNKLSLAVALHTAAVSGLSANPHTKHFSLVAYGDTVKLMVEYRGELHIMKRDFGLVEHHVGLVISDEKFSMDFQTGEYKHERINFRRVTEQNLLGGYAIAKLDNGKVVAVQRNINDILKSKDAAPMKKIWNDWFERMAYKTIVHALFDAVLMHSNPSVEKLADITALNNSTSNIDNPQTIDTNYEDVTEQEINETPEPTPEKISLTDYSKENHKDIDISKCENDIEIMQTLIENVTKKAQIKKITADFSDLFEDNENLRILANSKYKSL